MCGGTLPRLFNHPALILAVACPVTKLLLLPPPRSDVKAVALPPSLTGLTALTSLDLSDNPFEALAGQPHSMQALANLPNLQVRRGHGPRVHGCAALAGQVDDARCVPAARHSAPCFSPGPSVPQRLSLRCCQLPSVPADVCLLKGLTHLDLSRNQLVELPDGKRQGWGCTVEGGRARLRWWGAC